MEFKYRAGQRTTYLQNADTVPVIRYHIFDDLPVLCGVSTRMGGVSRGHLGAMNLSYTRGDDPERVTENHRLFARSLGYDEKRLVLSDQIHETTILRAEEKDAGCGVLQKAVDGLMTADPSLPLMTFYADCVPLLFYDPKKHVIAMSHSGWKGTVAKIGEKTVTSLSSAFGSRPEDILCAIGPSICQNCYEVDRPVKDAFTASFGQAAKSFFTPSENDDHYYLDLASACRYTLLSAGIQPSHLAMPDLCTCCNPELLFSHRASGGKRGNLAAVMQLLPA